MDIKDVVFGTLLCALFYGIGIFIACEIISGIMIWVEFPSKVGLLYFDGEWQFMAFLTLPEAMYVFQTAILPALIWGIPIGVGIGIGFLAFMSR